MINSAMKLAKRRKEKLVILWYLNPELNAAFEDLFQPILEPDITLINIHSLKDPRKLYYQLSAGQRFGDDDIRNNKTDDRLNDDFYRALKKRVYIFTCERFDPTKDYSLFVPTDTLPEACGHIYQRLCAPLCRRPYPPHRQCGFHGKEHHGTVYCRDGKGADSAPGDPVLPGHRRPE